MKKILSEICGSTLVELMVAVGVFSIFIVIMYPSFTFFSRQMNNINDKEILHENGQKIVNYIGEELRMSGFLTGSNPNVTHCGVTVNSLQHTDGIPYDSVSYLTSIPIETTSVNGLFLTLANNAVQGSINLTLNASDSDVSSDYIDMSGGGNALRLITFDTLAPSILQKAYQISSFAGNNITLQNSLAQTLNAGSRLFTVRLKEIIVDTTGGRRDLHVSEWDSSCNRGGITDNIYMSAGNNFSLGGVDGLQFEYTLNNNGTLTTVSTLTPNDLPYVRAVTIWILLRHQFPDNTFTDNTTYTLGTVAPVNIGPFNDNFRRDIFTKTVEVKNLAF
jgi:hypothetical protein